MSKQLMLGNEAIARGAYEAGVRLVSSYPGTPSTEITEYISEYDEIYCEWAPNEKVAVEVAIGSSIVGSRSMSAMKHVGLNVAADPLFTASYTGVNGGLVICVADDPGMHSSQNEQDSRHYARAAKILMLEPSDSAECLQFVKQAYELSEEYDTPVFIRLSTRVSHSRGIVEISGRVESIKEYKKDAGKYVMMPAMARARHISVEKRMADIKASAKNCPFNIIERNTNKIGIISSGISYQYAKEAMGDNASYLKLGVVYPLPDEMIIDFVNSVEVCYVIEELDPFIEEHCKSLGLDVRGKTNGGCLSLLGEYSAELVKQAITGETTDAAFHPAGRNLPNRPPALCPGCPHRGVFLALKQLKTRVSGDIGCYTLAALPPFSAMDACVCMGASVSMAHGMQKADGSDNSVAVIGDSTFIHSGITGLINTVYNRGTSTVLILDNSITGMTGHQHNPTTGYTIKNEPTEKVDLELLCKAIGVRRVVVADPFDVDMMKKIIKEETAAQEPSVIIARRPCALLKSVKFDGKFAVAPDKCKSCGLCLHGGCPAISNKEKKAVIDDALCIGCGYCAGLCKFDAINKPEVSKR